MKKLLIILAAACFCLFPVMARANTAATFALEIYTYDSDPDDPDYGCVLHAPLCPEICYHPTRPLVEDLVCYSAKVRYTNGIVPIHVGGLNEPIATGWPTPLPSPNGYAAVTLGVLASGISAQYTGLTPCPNFVQSAGTAPGAIVVVAYTQCHDWMDHPCYLKYFASVASTGATYFDVVMNADESKYAVINCAVEYDPTTIVGRAQWGGTKNITCPGPSSTAVTPTTWGNIKNLYR